MNRIATFLLAVALPVCVLAQGQRGGPAEVPGPPYDPTKHINPLITFVQSRDFKPSTYKEAQDSADLQLLGISKETGSLENIALAKPPLDASKELKINVKATFYPVVRQTFKVEGGEVDLCSFKAPKIQGGGFSPLTLGRNRGRGNNTKDKRFGDVPLPEELEVRGRRGLLFEQNGTLTVAWQEEGIMHTATSSLPRKDLFRVIDDLL